MNLDALEHWWSKRQFSEKERKRVYRKLATQLKNGVRLLDAIETLYKQAARKNEKHPHAVRYAAWRDGLSGGGKFADVLADWVPQTELMLIAAGERAGGLDKALLRTVDALSAGSQMKTAIRGAMIYPLILFAAAFIVMWGFGSFIIPPFAEVSDPKTWQGAAHHMYLLAEFTKTGLLPLVAVVVIALVAVVYSMPRLTGNIRVTLDRLPPWSIYRLYMGSGFLTSLAALIKAGVAVQQAAQQLRTGASPWLRERLDGLLLGLRSGRNLGVALHESGYGFPDQALIDDLQIYASMAGFDQNLEMLGREWLEEGIAQVEAQAAKLRGIAMVLMGTLIAWMAYGLFALQQQLTNSIQGIS